MPACRCRQPPATVDKQRRRIRRNGKRRHRRVADYAARPEASHIRHEHLEPRIRLEFIVTTRPLAAVRFRPDPLSCEPLAVRAAAPAARHKAADHGPDRATHPGRSIARNDCDGDGEPGQPTFRRCLERSKAEVPSPDNNHEQVPTAMVAARTCEPRPVCRGT